ncbi:GNAT family protein [Pontibacter sp. G13]|uniref:GNAT family N-acetyltransferase n=1 Tax=Pontibacter sp. G13 TaxID=3074898 RepID=UPI00288AB2BD|nr:GNAT family protein [Pontibacter sp. G13]WNJ17616.1 GNAT family protein [Pontibacter sp. G13]
MSQPPSLFHGTAQLDRIQLSDWEDMLPLTQHSGMWQYFTQDLSQPTELEDWVKQAVQAWDSGTRWAFTIRDRATGEMVGSTSLGSMSLRDCRIEIGWTWIAPTFWGKGFNDSSKAALLHWAFGDWKALRVEVKTDVLNQPARKALVRMGFVEEGVLRSHTRMVGGRRRDTIYYSILPDEWSQIQTQNNW